MSDLSTNRDETMNPGRRCPKCGGLRGALYGQSTGFGDRQPPIKGHRRGCTTAAAKRLREIAVDIMRRA